MKNLMLLGCCVLLLAVPSTARSQGVAFGPQLSYGTDSDFGVGGRAVLGLSQFYESLEGILSGDYFFVDCGGADCSWIELNANATIPIEISPTLRPYVGGGLNVARFSVDLDEFGSSSNTEFGLNVLGGLRFGGTSFIPFAEARLELGGGEQFVLTGGVLFGGGR